MTASEFRLLVGSPLATDVEVDLLVAYRGGSELSASDLVALSNYPGASDALRHELMAKASAAQARELADAAVNKKNPTSSSTQSVAAAVPTCDEQGAAARAVEQVGGNGSNAESEKRASSLPVRVCNLQNAAGWEDDLDGLSDKELWGYFKEGGVGDARLFNRLNRDRIIFVDGWNRFLVWQGHHWCEDKYSIAYQRTESVVRAYQRLAEKSEAIIDDPASTKDEVKEAESTLATLERRIKGIRSRSGQENLLTQVSRVFNPLKILPDEIDQKPYLLACPNGVINLKTGVLSDGEPSDYLLNSCPTKYRPDLAELDDPCPETTRFLMSSMDGNREMVDFIWRVLGYGMIRERKDHVFVIFWGAHGRNGKDTLIKLMTHVLGKELSGNIPVELFLQTSQTRNSSAPSPDVMALRGMCLAWINEAEDGQRFAMARLKALTGGGLITARGLMDRSMTTFAQTHLPVMTTNELPRAKSDDEAFWQRALIVRWDLSFVGEPDPEKDYQRKADKHLDEKIQNEAEGVLVRLVRGAMEYVRDGLVVPPQVRAWTRDQRDTQDDLAAFLEECCVVEQKRDVLEAYQTKIRSNELYDAWSLWFAENRDRKNIPSNKRLGIMLDKREFPKKVSNGTWRLGLDLTTEWQDKLDQQSPQHRNGSASFRGGSDASF